MNPDTLAKLEAALAPERIDAYRQDGADSVITMARYLLNMALCESLYSPLQIAEVALRNSLHQHLTQKTGQADWYDQPIGLPDWQLKQIQAAKRSLQSNQKPLNDGRIIAELNFGFWTGFFNNAHLNNGLGFMLAGKAFPHAPKSERKIRNLNHHWTVIRQLRNRVFHHERIIHWSDLDQQHAILIEAIHWISPELAKLSKTLDRYTQIRQAGLKPWIEKLEI
ncbi:MAG: hypothetical protein AAGB04_25870 [Pseudomonadota bacterium]